MRMPRQDETATQDYWRSQSQVNRWSLYLGRKNH